MKPTRRTLLVTIALSALSTSALASTHAGQQKAQRYEVQTTLSSIKAGAARIRVRAPATSVERVVRDFNHYKDFIQRFERSHVLGHHAGRTDVYLQVPILRGAARVWAVVRFEPPKTVNGEQVIEAHLLKGNVKRLDAWWRIKPIDKHHTRLALEMLIVPKLPVPGSLVTGEVAFAADTAVSGARDRAEQLEAKRHRK